MKRLSKVDTTWSANLAYAIGVIATDGNLSPSGRSINITSKDLDMIENIKECLLLKNRIGRKANGSSLNNKIYYVIQFGDKNFYEFLNKIGITSNKSKTISILSIPNDFFIDFLRGCIDGDGNIDIFLHKESTRPQIKLRLCSASVSFLIWIKEQIESNFKISTGSIYSDKSLKMHTLSYGKRDTGKILKLMYYKGVRYYLKRKYLKALPYIG